MNRNVYIIVYKGGDGLEQYGNDFYYAPCQAQEKIMQLEKQYGKSMKFQLCKVSIFQMEKGALTKVEE